VEKKEEKRNGFRMRTRQASGKRTAKFSPALTAFVICPSCLQCNVSRKDRLRNVEIVLSGQCGGT
jgi:hypothetical protein